ncbi:MAG TPA: DUF402 domain-containing protein [Bacilli bacterium]|nr:DUF402 domain-containing protein [Bacilli bacterium]HPK86189.1 DUF402 domain-containing protein [Bacilli bacterium]
MSQDEFIGKWIRVQSYKHDGTLHRLWKSNFVLENNEDWLIVASKCTKVVEFNGRVWYTAEPAVTFFSKKRWFNAIAMIKKDGIAFYVNIASPTLIDNKIAKYIDYDLDIKMNANNDLRFLDRNEFRKHVESYEYGDDLVEIIREEAINTHKLMEENAFPFDIDEVSKYYLTFLEMTEKKKE